jgi:ATP-binding cassette subfamily E protein 1
MPTPPYMVRYFDTKDLRIRLLKPLNVLHLLDRRIGELSGGELQRVFLAGALGREADLYLIDEGSAFLDVEERLKATRVMRYWAEKRKAAIIAIEHDLQIADAIADRLMLFFGEPGKFGHAYGPFSKREGMNRFLRHLEVTFRRDESTGRARINKPDSKLDKHQREIGEYYYDR